MVAPKSLERTRRRFFFESLILALLVAGVLLSGQAWSAPASYPVKPVELIIPWTAGGATDIIGRLFAKYASPHFGQPVVVTNKAGAGGLTATAEVAKSAADGYKLLLQSISLHVIQAKTQKFPFSSALIVPIANFTEGIQGCVVQGEAPWKTFQDLLEFGRKNPGKLTWSHAGVGIPPHMSMEVALEKAGVKGVGVPYKGTPEAMAAILGGHVKAGSMNYSALKDQVAAGKMRYLTIWRDKRYEEMPDVPASEELGFQESALIRSFFGIYAHKNTPPEVIRFIEDACQKVCNEPGFKKDLSRLGQPLYYLNSAELGAFISRASSQVTPVLKRLGLYIGEQ